MPIFDLKAVNVNSYTQPNNNTNVDKVANAKVAVGKGWEVVRNMN